MEKKFSGKTPSAGAGTNLASGAFANSGALKSGCLSRVTALKIRELRIRSPQLSKEGYGVAVEGDTELGGGWNVEALHEVASHSG